MKRDKFLYQHHIMWYEVDMVLETLDSVFKSYTSSRADVDFKICLNSQTYLETPIEGTASDMFLRIMDHPIIKIADLTYKGDSDPFYNIGDWRREIYDPTYKYTIWGESDCLMPQEFFSILEDIRGDLPHILTFASRKMWDSSWDIVEHRELEKIGRRPGNPYQAPHPLNSSEVISLDRLNEFNSKFPVEAVGSAIPKIDGSLLCISGGIDFKFIPDNMHFVREDTCAEIVFRLKGVPQIIVKTKLKGHNYTHPKKRINTDGTRNDSIWKEKEKESLDAMYKFIERIKTELDA